MRTAVPSCCMASIYSLFPYTGVTCIRVHGPKSRYTCKRTLAYKRMGIAVDHFTGLSKETLFGQQHLHRAQLEYFLRNWDWKLLFSLFWCLLTTRFNNLISCAVAATFPISSWSLSRTQIANLQLLRGGPIYLCFCTIHLCWARYCCHWKTCVALDRDSCQHRTPACVYVHVSLVIVLPDTWKYLRVLFATVKEEIFICENFC